MIKLFTGIAIAMLYGTPANALIGPDCMEDTKITTDITNGQRVRTNCAYVSPNCTNNCRCCTESPMYRCSCNSGYYVKGQGEATCSCVKCPVANSTCSSDSYFTCNKGYYKNGNTCSRCPSSGGVYGTTSSSGATSITECYIPSGTSGSDASGNFTYTGNCYYIN